MQWAIEQHGRESAADRGNWPEAAQDASPGWLTGKRQYVAFAALRSYPVQQVRKICVALRERSLPLDHPAVHVLLKQALFHLGDVGNESSSPAGRVPQVQGVAGGSGGEAVAAAPIVADPAPVEPALRALWRTDLFEHGGWSTLHAELNGLTEQLLNKPREHGTLLLLGELAAVASQWDPAIRLTARELARVARKWASDLTMEVDSPNTSLTTASVLRARQCIFYMYSMICNCTGALSPTDAAALCEGAVLAEYSRIFEDPTPLEDTVCALTTVTANVMARRLPDVLQALDATPAVLTAAVKLVLESTPDVLDDWCRVVVNGTTTSCFEALARIGDV